MVRVGGYYSLFIIPEKFVGKIETSNNDIFWYFKNSCGSNNHFLATYTMNPCRQKQESNN